MENIPQSSDSPYHLGQQVRIYLTDDDIDAQYHGLVCKIIEDNPDDLGELTGRDVDNHLYRLQQVETGDKIPTSFRHEDLVPVSEWPVRE